MIICMTSPFWFLIFCFSIFFILCIKLEENFENLPCEKLCQLKVTKFLSADENLYRWLFFFLIQNLKVNYSEMTSAVDRKSQGILQQNQIMNLQWKEPKLFKKWTNKKAVYRMLQKWTLLHKSDFLIVLKIS